MQRRRRRQIHTRWYPSPSLSHLSSFVLVALVFPSLFSSQLAVSVPCTSTRLGLLSAAAPMGPRDYIYTGLLCTTDGRQRARIQGARVQRARNKRSPLFPNFNIYICRCFFPIFYNGRPKCAIKACSLFSCYLKLENLGKEDYSVEYIYYRMYKKKEQKKRKLLFP